MSIFYNKTQKVNSGDTGGLKLWRLRPAEFAIDYVETKRLPEKINGKRPALSGSCNDYPSRKRTIDEKSVFFPQAYC